MWCRVCPRLLPRLTEVAEFKSLDVYGEMADGELKELLNSFGAVFHRRIGGFTR